MIIYIPILVCDLCLISLALLLAPSVSLAKSSESLIKDYSHSVVEEHARGKRAATADKSRLWPNATVPYEFDKNLSGKLKSFLEIAIEHWQNKTCVRFTPKVNVDKDYVVFTTEPCGCCSSVGRVGGRQTLSLTGFCATQSVAIHELGHVVGFWHEHTRPDRDSEIQVLWNNILKSHHKNFHKRDHFEIDSLGRPYDFASIMHYSPGTFSNGKGDTMVKYDGQRLAGQVTSLSTEDIIQTTLLYQCPEPKCDYVVATTEDGKVTSPYYPNRYTSNLDCVWTLHVPKGQILTLQFINFNLQDSYRCSADYLEIREVDETGPLIGRFCGSGLLPPIKSSNRLWLSFHSNWVLEKQGFIIHYSFDDIKPIDILKLNGDRGDSTILKESVCVNVSTAAHGLYKSVEIPTGQLFSSVSCSFILDSSQSTESRMKLRLHTNQSRAYGADCMGRIYTLMSNDNSTDGTEYVGVFESSGDADSEHSLDAERWSQMSYVCLGSNRVIEVLLDSKIALITWVSTEHRALYLEYWIDYDECAVGKSSCDHTCLNTIEGYQCICYNGYQLVNGHVCVPKIAEIEDRCYQQLTAPTGKIISSSEPYHLCSYNVLQAGRKITLKFTKLSLPFSGNCSLNYVEVKSHKNLIAHLCDDVSGYELTVGDTITILQYVNTSLSLRLPFFVAEYYSVLKQTEACQSHLFGFGELTSDNYPGSYDPNTHCIWKLSVRKGEIIVLHILDIDIEYTNKCQFDRLEVYDGRNKKAPVLKLLCGNQSLNETLYSTGHRLTIRFLSDGSGNGRGFRMKFSSMDPYQG